MIRAILFVGVLFSFIGYPVTTFACMSASVRLNDNVTLLGDGYYKHAINAKGEVETSVFKAVYMGPHATEHNERYKKGEISYPIEPAVVGKALDVKDLQGRVTHTIMILGSHRDAGDVYFTSYLIRTPASGELPATEKVVILNSNYGGMSADGKTYYYKSAVGGKTEPSKNFSMLEHGVGCGGTK